MSDQTWHAQDVAEVGIGYHGTGVAVHHICCARHSLTMTADEARGFAAALLAAADQSDEIDSVNYLTSWPDCFHIEHVNSGRRESACRSCFPSRDSREKQ